MLFYVECIIIILLVNVLLPMLLWLIWREKFLKCCLRRPHSLRPLLGALLPPVKSNPYGLRTRDHNFQFIASLQPQPSSQLFRYTQSLLF